MLPADSFDLSSRESFDATEIRLRIYGYGRLRFQQPLLFFQLRNCSPVVIAVSKLGNVKKAVIVSSSTDESAILVATLDCVTRVISKSNASHFT